MPISKVTALSLAATGPLLIVGAIIHPHAPDAQNMAEVAYAQTGQTAWWPAHVFLLEPCRVRDIPTQGFAYRRIAVPGCASPRHRSAACVALRGGDGYPSSAATRA